MTNQPTASDNPTTEQPDNVVQLGEARPAASVGPRRARARHGEPSTHRERVFAIATLIAGGEWLPRMADELAAEWRLSPVTVRHMAAEASRLVEYTTGDRQKLVNLARLKLRQIMLEDGPDRVQAARTLLEHLGELRQVHTVGERDPFEGWTEEEIRRYADTGVKPARGALPGAIAAHNATSPSDDAGSPSIEHPIGHGDGAP